MFSLTSKQLKLNILSVADGPASFNCELTSKDGSVTSIDPLYKYTKQQLKSRIDEVFETVLEEARRNKNKFVWKNIHSVKELGEIRMRAMEAFLSDFEKGKKQKRYIAAELPNLPFRDKQFDLCLCSHFLFLYSGHLSLNFHHQALAEMIRVSKEVRVFPLLTLNGDKSEYLNPTIDNLINKGHTANTKKVNYEFQRGGNEILVINC
jgi:hypothetical protein